MTYRKKLIEVALPLDAINKASAKEKSIRHGHPSTLHLWWARRPLATCRAVLFASLVDDPSEHSEEFPTEQEQDQERERLFGIIEALVKWENSNNEEILQKARAEILKSTHGNPPPVLDPFAGGGSIPLEAQRLGLEAHASDLNPVAVLINKALIEIPPKFAGLPPVNPDAKKTLLRSDWSGAHGLADDIRYYGRWMRDEAERRIGHLYPKVTLPQEYGGGEATVIAWIWTRTVKCSNPACGAKMPLISSWWLSKKKGKETWIDPIVDSSVAPPIIKFSIKKGKSQPADSPKIGRGAQFKCLCCGNVAIEEYIRDEGMADRMGTKLMAVVAEGKIGRVYLPPTPEQEMIAKQAEPQWRPEQDMPKNPRWFSPPIYGMATFDDIFTSRQLVALTTFSDLVQDVHQHVLTDAKAAGISEDAQLLHAGGCGAVAYADAVVTYLGMGVSRLSDICNALCGWENTKTQVRHLFARQAIPMLWDFAEPNVFAEAAGDFGVSLGNLVNALETTPANGRSVVKQQDATAPVNGVGQPMISTDPPYYDNIGYADLSDFFYVWLRRSLRSIYPDIFETVLVPKAQELVATPYRFSGNKYEAQKFFETGLEQAFEQMRRIHHPDYPLTVYYAFKQAETETNGDREIENKGNENRARVTASTGWETMLEGLIRSGFTITGTWPMRTELANRSLGMGTNALASSIVLVCRPRPTDARPATRRQFLNALKMELGDALKKMQHGDIAPVDLAQASIGPGMAVYSRYSKVVESDGTPLRVRTALQLINQALDEVLAEQEGEFDMHTRWAVSWFEQYAMDEGPYGVAETLSKARNISLHHLEEMGILVAQGGRVRLRKREEYSGVLGGRSEAQRTVWEVTQRMIDALMNGKGVMGGETGAGSVLRQAGEQGAAARDLAYRLYTICDRKGWSGETLPYNTLVLSWSEISRLARQGAGEMTLWGGEY